LQIICNNYKEILDRLAVTFIQFPHDNNYIFPEQLRAKSGVKLEQRWGTPLSVTGLILPAAGWVYPVKSLLIDCVTQAAKIKITLKFSAQTQTNAST